MDFSYHFKYGYCRVNIVKDSSGKVVYREYIKDSKINYYLKLERTRLQLKKESHKS